MFCIVVFQLDFWCIIGKKYLQNFNGKWEGGALSKYPLTWFENTFFLLEKTNVYDSPAMKMQTLLQYFHDCITETAYG